MSFSWFQTLRSSGACVKQKPRFIARKWRISAGMISISTLPQAQRLVYKFASHYLSSFFIYRITKSSGLKSHHSRLRLWSQETGLQAANLLDRSKVKLFRALRAGESAAEPSSRWSTFGFWGKGHWQSCGLPSQMNLQRERAFITLLSLDLASLSQRQVQRGATSCIYWEEDEEVGWNLMRQHRAAALRSMDCVRKLN